MGISKMYHLHTHKNLRLSPSLGSNDLTSKGIAALLQYLKESNSKLESVNLSGNQFDSNKAIISMGMYMQGNIHIQSIDISASGIKDGMIIILADYLNGNLTFNKLNFLGNKGVTDISVPYLREIIENSYIADICISNTSISAEKQREIFNHLKKPFDERQLPVQSKSKSAAKIL